MDQQPTGFAEGLDKLQQEAVVHISPLPAQPLRSTSSHSTTGPINGERPLRSTSSHSTTGPINGERPPSRALSAAGMDEGRPQSTPPLADHHHQSRISTNIVSINQSRYTTGTIPKSITKLQLTFVSIICYLQKTDTALALTMTRKVVMWKSA